MKRIFSGRDHFLKIRLLCYTLVICTSFPVFAVIDESYVTTTATKNCFTLAKGGIPVSILVSSQDYIGVQYAVKDLQADICKVTGSMPEIVSNNYSDLREAVLIGTIGKNPIIDQLIAEGKIDVSTILGKWESFIIQSIDKPIKGIEKALIIVGSDKRGTIYGVYDLSQQIGVSPWYWWADVPITQKSDLYILPGVHTLGEPAVKYRGIFINDEAPALSGWTSEKFGGFNHMFYEHVFELILRLKGNFLWPAMWGNAFYDDDSLNAKLADDYGVVIGTSHHEPLMRAHDEWRRYGSGPWNYDKNPDKLRAFWKEGMIRTGLKESIVTVGMRGDGDEPMTEGTAIALLEKIVSDQRQIINEVTGKDPAETPQVWALYKEVQEYYDKGMRVPEDITLLLCDDNWGNVRRLPKPGEPKRDGGYGMYYHFDFVGGPRNYKWLNTNPIARIWEQMHLSYEHGVDRIWIVNVGDIKPMEYPIQFFLDYAWNPNKWQAGNIAEYPVLWAQQQFGDDYAQQIAGFLNNYTRFNSRRKPEMLSPDVYNLINYREAERVVNEYDQLYVDAKKVLESLPKDMHDAYYQLVLHPIEACSNLNRLYYTISKYQWYLGQLRSATNDLAAEANQLFQRDADITRYYNEVMSGGKWNHIMDQTHIGYTSWQQPEKNSIPELKNISIPNNPSMGVAIEGSAYWWPKEKSEAILPDFNCYQKQEYYIEIFNRSKTPFNYNIVANQPWIAVSNTSGTIEKETRIKVWIDWLTIPYGQQMGCLTVEGPSKDIVNIKINAYNFTEPSITKFKGFIESNGYISIETEHFSAAFNDNHIHWEVIPGMGRTLSGVTAMPTITPEYTIGRLNPRLEYPVYLFNKGEIKINVLISPTLNYYNDDGLKYGISIDNEPPQIVRIHANDTIQDWRYPEIWNQSVSNNIRILTTNHSIDNPGEHILKLWMITPGVVFQKIIIDTGGLKPSYLGPPESFHQLGTKKD